MVSPSARNDLSAAFAAANASLGCASARKCPLAGGRSSAVIRADFAAQVPRVPPLERPGAHPRLDATLLGRTVQPYYASLGSGRVGCGMSALYNKADENECGTDYARVG
jgi:hypothetical protein